MSTENSELLGKNGMGIPASIFDTKRAFGDVIAGSGLEITYYIDPTMILIDSERREQSFIAKIDSDGIAHFAIRNSYFRGQKKERHPDIFAFQLMKKSLEHFNKKGEKVVGIEGEWEGKYDQKNGFSSDNYEQFKGFLDNLGHSPSNEELIEACKGTWTGKACAQLGYSQVKIENLKIEDKGSYPVVKVVFLKNN